MASLIGKVAIVTGASRGIGRAIAERLGNEGASIVVNYVQDARSAKAVVEAIASAGSQALAVRADMSKLPDVRHLFEATADHFGRLDILVNSAGMFMMKSLSEVTEEDFDAMFAVNAKGTFFALQEAARRIGPGGRIINISSCSTEMMFAGASLYVGSKAAGEQFTKTLA
jgi:3-oxoacyl-[acyl-carrier protein] reductase